MLRTIRHRLCVRKPLLHRQKTSIKTIDLSEPHIWYDDARQLKRNIICHVGGTNSGKTYNALAALGAANNGVYCGPLRLLAWEVQGTLTNKGVKCSLVTGQEREYIDGETHISCTVEMADLTRKFDVAVIDEAQLLGDESRGWAWTQAFLGLRAKEIHLCGSPSMLPIIKSLCVLTNDNITVKSYSRLTPLTVSAKSLRTFKKIEPGDCVVGFGRRGLFDTKREIEEQNPGLKCCVIYGGLPPDARKDQARLFSTPDNGYDVLVASDAIGMGLNLSIRRIIFSTIYKFDGKIKRALFSDEIKQIAGRAGRYGTQYENGEVTCMNHDDLKLVRQGMQIVDKPITKAGLFPSLEQLQLLSVLINYEVTSKMLKGFWLHVLCSEWGSDVDIDDSSRLFSHLSATVVVRNFGSIGEFSRQLGRYLMTNHTSRPSRQYGRRRKISETGEDLGEYDEDSTFFDPVLENREMIKQNAARLAFMRGENISAEESAALEQFHVDSLVRKEYDEKRYEGTLAAPENNAIKNAYERLMQNDREKGGEKIVLGASANLLDGPPISQPVEFNILNSISHRGEKIDTGDPDNPIDPNIIIESPTSDYDMLLDFVSRHAKDQDRPGNQKPYEPRESQTMSVPLSKLYSIFHSNSDMGDSGHYFLCDLEDKIELARSIDSVPMTFRTRYIFCMAPVNSDNKVLLNRFSSFAVMYARTGKVHITDTALYRPIPRTPAELLEIETLHQYYECYLWLSQRFPAEFLDSKIALQESKHCANLVDLALKSFVDRSEFRVRKLKKKSDKEGERKPVLQVDRIFNRTEGDSSSGELTSRLSLSEISEIRNQHLFLARQPRRRQRKPK